MNLDNILNEIQYHGPADTLERLAREVNKRKGTDAAFKWAAGEIRTMLGSISQGNGRTVHDKLNDISALISALHLYVDDGFNDQQKKDLEKSYQRVIERARAKK